MTLMTCMEKSVRGVPVTPCVQSLVRSRNLYHGFLLGCFDSVAIRPHQQGQSPMVCPAVFDVRGFEFTWAKTCALDDLTDRGMLAQVARVT